MVFGARTVSINIFHDIMYIISGASFHIIVISFFVYLFVNFFENLIHYNIGKFSNQETKLELPSKKDFVKIVVVMFVFALLQGILTSYFSNYLKK
jgi:hypothetical protein